MDTNTIGIINFPNPQNIEEIAKWSTLFYTPSNQPCNYAPLIEPYPLPNGVKSLQAIMAATGEQFEPIYQPFTEEEMVRGAQQYWAYLDVPGVFDMSQSLLTTAMIFWNKRQLTRCELILVMKCEFLANFRMDAMNKNFDFSRGMSEIKHECTTCICSIIPFK